MPWLAITKAQNSMSFKVLRGEFISLLPFKEDTARILEVKVLLLGNFMEASGQDDNIIFLFITF